MGQQEVAKGVVVGKWRVEKPLGAGGQAAVWLVRYVEDRHSPPGALKLCSGRDEKARARFSREIDLLRGQSHPGIVRVRDSGEHYGLPFLVMERATTTLADVSAADSAGTRLVLESREIFFRFLRQACDAVAHLHSKGVLHRDIKPSNILLMLDPPEPMRAVVADLGIATSQSDGPKLTATHELIGTPAFRAPESLNGQHTTRSDVYSLGKTIEAVLNRGAPVEMGPGKCLRDQRLTDALWDVLDGVLARACAFDPALRYENAGVLLQALPEVVLGISAGGRADSPARRPTSISLSIPERATLADIIAACPAGEELANLDQVRHKSRLSEYQFAMAVRRLESVDFVETVMQEGDFGSRFAEVRPTLAAIQWAHEHHEEIEAARVALAPKSEEDDIPF